MENSEKIETDPNGLSPHDPGAKLDDGKPRSFLMMSGFGKALNQLGGITAYGAKKYKPGGWAHVPDGEQRYLDAGARHLLQADTPRPEDEIDESGYSHLAHTAWNILAALELRIRKDEERQILG